jgi:acyl transferase domain-containing protein/NAD(P)-dependent dehydrogenase (short-subunit alcohol dehydrogenase family)/NAD(P)H-dependent flavin oxidoreductase YrpB (nitropropane dioxygenase family)
MTHVSDVPEFCFEVARHGALPFLALALMRGPDVRRCLQKTAHLLGEMPWGVGILGFVPPELRREQLSVIEEIRPRYAIIAGGRPDQAASLEASGIHTYLHVPSPGMLDTFLREGARRFVFEGRECGGHVGPRTSFVLWEAMIQVLLDARLTDQQTSEVHVLFAGGIHDGRSAAMVAALAQPLVDRGMKIGVLLGTAYLGTREIVETGAIVEGFQEVTLASERTVLVEAGPGHAIRCADTSYVRLFEARKRQLKAQSASHEQIREELERLNLGRLRVASKGIARRSQPIPGDSPYCRVDGHSQREQGMYMLGQIAALRRQPCTLAELHQQVSQGSIERLAIPQTRAEIIRDRRPAPAPLDIAIIGMGCLLPGATDPETYWDNILAKRDLIQEVPPERFEVDRWYDADRSARDKIYSRWGGFVSEILFDPFKFGIPPAALKSIEPMQLLALELVARALTDAGYAHDNPHRERTSVVLGVGGGAAELGVGYGFRSLLPKFFEHPEEAMLAELPEWTEDSFAGILLNVVAGRVANRFDLGGTNFTVDAACASSLAAVYLACRELASGAADMVVTGGCDTMQGPMGYLCFAKTGALSPRGRSRPFDVSADGIAISEGHAAVVLKRRADAERDGDRIYAVIRAAAGGSDGRHKGLTAPRLEGQLQTLKRAYAQAGFSPASVALFEAHGTGTAVGDQAEALALQALLKEADAPLQTAALGSVKSMIGHTKCAAGVAGLLKAALALHRRVLPPTLHVERPNPKAGLENGPLYVNSEARPWLRHGSPRRAGVSAFGFGGSNFHVALEEYLSQPASTRRHPSHRGLSAELFLFAAGTTDRLVANLRLFLKELDEALAAGAEISLADLAFTHHLRQMGGDAGSRAAIVASSAAELRDQLGALIAKISGGKEPSKLPPGIHYTTTPLALGTPLALVFPGQGSQYPDMLRGLAVDFPQVAACIERADALARQQADIPLGALMYPPPRFREEDRLGDSESLKRTEVAQLALAAGNAALWGMLQSLQIEPSMVAGHSFGELVALHAAGCFDEQKLFELALARGQSMAATIVDHPDAGRMIAVAASVEDVEKAIADCGEAWLANLNSPKQTVVSGCATAIDQARRRLEQAGLAYQALAVASAFHTPLMKAAGERFGDILKQTAVHSPAMAVYSNVTASTYPADPSQIKTLLTRQITSPVQFQPTIEAMYAAGARVFIEVGPGRVLSGLVAETLRDRPHATIPLNLRGADDTTTLLRALASLYSHGARLNVECLFEGRNLKEINLRQLAEQARRGPPAHLWLLHGSGIRPAQEPPRPAPARGRFVPLEAIGDDSAKWPLEKVRSDHSRAALHNRDDEPGVAANHKSDEPLSIGETLSLKPNRNHPELAARDEAQAQFQETMRQFLEVQRQVMLAYLGQADTPDTPSQAAIAGHWQYPPVAPAQPSSAPGEALEPVAPPEAAIHALSPDPGTPFSSNGAADKVDAVEHLAVPAPQPSKNGAGPALDERLLNIVSQRTGYPVEMLDLDANLEADLGIDSIKRVEIIAAFRREALPEMQEPTSAFMERMTAAKTMRSMLSTVEDLAGANGAATTPTPSSTDGPEAHRPDPTIGQQQSLLPRQGCECPRCVPVPVDAPLVPEESRETWSGVWLISSDGHGLAEAVAQQLSRRGGRARIIPRDDLNDARLLAQRVENARRDDAPLRGLLHLASLCEAPTYPGLDGASWRQFADAELKSLLHLLQALAPELAAEQPLPFRVLVATRGGGDFGDAQGMECLHPWRGGLAGMLKTAAKEWPAAIFRAMDCDELPQAVVLLEELSASGEVEVGYRLGRRLALRPSRMEHPAESLTESHAPLSPSDVVVVLGGAKGVTAAVAHELAERSRATMILVGRSPLPEDEEGPSTAGVNDPLALRRAILEELRETTGGGASREQVESRFRRLVSDREIRSTLAALAAAGSHVEYHACDVQDPTTLANLLSDVRRRHGRIAAVIHGAGIIEDRHVTDKDAASFDRVIQTKVAPLLTLSSTLAPDELKLLVLFSSVSGFFGNPGQVDYAAANEMLNRMARRLRDVWSCHVVSLNWGPWSGAGMVTPEVARQFASRGVGMVTLPTGRAAAWREISHRGQRDVRVLLGPGSWIEGANHQAEQPHAVIARTPLLADQRVRRLAPAALEAELALDLQRHVFLGDHVIDGKPVVPLAFVVEIMAEVVACADPRRRVREVRDLRQLSGIVMSTSKRTLRVVAQLKEDLGQTSTWNVRLTDPAAPGRPLYEAIMTLADGQHAPQDAPNLEPLAGSFPLDVDEAYQQWLFHGPRFQAIDFYRGFDETGVDVVIRPSRPRDALPDAKNAAWLIDPVAIDVAPQLAALWSRARTDTMLLPSRFQTLRLYDAIGSDPLEVYLRVIKTDGNTISANAWYLRDGQLLAEIRELECAGSRQLNRITGGTLVR